MIEPNSSVAMPFKNIIFSTNSHFPRRKKVNHHTTPNTLPKKKRLLHYNRRCLKINNEQEFSFSLLSTPKCRVIHLIEHLNTKTNMRKEKRNEERSAKYATQQFEYMNKKKNIILIVFCISWWCRKSTWFIYNCITLAIRIVSVMPCKSK